MSLKRSLAWMGWAQAISIVLQFASSIVLARYLTPYETGIFGLAFATIGVLSLIQTLGLQALVVREEVLTPEITATVFTINAIISLLLSIMIVVASVAGGAFLGEVGVQRVMLVLAATPLFGIFAFLPAALLERNGNFRALAVIGTTSGLVASTATVAFAIAGFSYMSVAWAQWLSGAVTVVLANVLGRRYAAFRVGFKSWRRVADFGFQMFAISGIFSITSRISEVALGRLLGLSALGFYNRATGINNIVWNNIHLVIGRVLFVDFADLHRSGRSLRERYLQTVAMMTAILWPAFAGLVVISKPFIYYVYGAKWVGSADALLFLSLGSLGLVAITMTWEIFAATGNLKIQTGIEFKRALLSLAIFVGGCFISLRAAAASRVVDAVFAFFLYRSHLDRMTDTSLKDVLPIYARSGGLMLLAILPASVLMMMWDFAPAVPLVQLGGAVALGFVLWGAGLSVLCPPLLGEVRKTLAGRLRRVTA